SEIVSGLVGLETAVGSLPGGTVNLWAREIGLVRRLDQAAQQLVAAKPRRADVGRVTITSAQGPAPRERHFLFLAGLGAGGALTAGVSKPLKTRVGRMAVGLAALRALPSLRPAPIQARVGPAQWAGRAWQVVVGNTRLYGGFTHFTPEAVMDDGLLDICVL